MKTFKKIISLLLCLALMCVVFTGCGEEGNSKDVLVVGMTISSDGVFESRDANGDPWGVGVEIVEAFGEYIGQEVVIENIAWDGLIPSLQTNKIDMILSSMTITEAREEQVDFSDPYVNAYLAILASSGSGINSVEDLNQDGMKVAVTNGSTGYHYAIESLPKAEVLALEDAGACITEVVQGKADGFIRDQLSVYRANQQNPEETKAVLIPFQDTEHWGAAFNEDNDALREEFNKFLAEYKAEGGFEKLTEEYMAEYKAAFDKLGFRWFFDFEE